MIDGVGAGIMAAMPGVADLSPVYLAAMVCAINGGATAFSHVNDSGFWLVSSLLEIDEKTTLKSWTMMETIIGITGLVSASPEEFVVFQIIGEHETGIRLGVAVCHAGTVENTVLQTGIVSVDVPFVGGIG